MQTTEKAKNLGLRTTPEKQRQLKQWALDNSTTVQGIFDALTDQLLSKKIGLSDSASAWPNRVMPKDSNSPELNNLVILRADHALGGYDGGIEDAMRFIYEFLPELTADEERLIQRICQSLRLNIEITVRAEARDGQQEKQGHSDNEQQPSADAKVRELEDIARRHPQGQADIKRPRRRAR